MQIDEGTGISVLPAVRLRLGISKQPVPGVGSSLLARSSRLKNDRGKIPIPMYPVR